MSPKIRVLSKYEAIKFNPARNSGIIRVLEPFEDFYSVNGDFKEAHVVQFHDALPSPNLPSNTVYFNEKMADDLILAFQQMKDCELVVFHCHAGISRSPAIALSFAWFMKDADMVDYIKTLKIVPNALVMAIMAKKIGVWEENKEFILHYVPDSKLERVLANI